MLVYTFSVFIINNIIWLYLVANQINNWIIIIIINS